MSDIENIKGRMRAAWVTTPVGEDRWGAVLDILHAAGYRRCAEGQRTTQWCDRAEKAEAEAQKWETEYARIAGDYAEETSALTARYARIAGDYAEEVFALTARAEEAEAEVERLRADAARYRWLRNAQTGKAVNCVASSAFPAWLNGPELDAAIDAARGES